MDIIKKSFGARLKEIRESRFLNQEQLAELVHMESRQISRIETGKSFTTLENIYKLANALDVNISALFEFQHKRDKDVLIREITSYLQNADNDKLELAYKLICSLFN